MSEAKKQFKQDYPVYIKQGVIWGDMDAFEHVNNTVYFRYFEDIRMEFFEQTGVMKHKDTTGIGPILASTQCQFRAPLSFPDQIYVGTRIVELPSDGDKRFTMEYAVFSEQHDAIAAKGEGLIVYYDYNINKSCEIPQTLIKAFKHIQHQNKH
jgi:acyl-CoA thioester hydrolase